MRHPQSPVPLAPSHAVLRLTLCSLSSYCTLSQLYDVSFGDKLTCATGAVDELVAQGKKITCGTEVDPPAHWGFAPGKKFRLGDWLRTTKLKMSATATEEQANAFYLLHTKSRIEDVKTVKTCASIRLCSLASTPDSQRAFPRCIPCVFSAEARRITGGAGARGRAACGRTDGAQSTRARAAGSVGDGRRGDGSAEHAGCCWRQWGQG